MKFLTNRKVCLQSENGKTVEMNGVCNFTGWIEEGQMLKVYVKALDKIIKKIRDIFEVK